MADYTDNFNRANGALGSPWVVVDGGLTVASNKCATPDAGLNTSRYNQTVGANQYAEADVVCTSGGRIGPTVRFTSGGDFYYLWVNGTNLALNKRVGGTYSQVGTDGPTALNTFKARIEAQGTAIRVYVNGSLAISVVDSPGIATGQPGILGGNAAGITADNFACGDIVVPPTVPDQITTLAAVPAGVTSVALTWALPYDGNSAITDHVVDYGTNGTTWTTFSHSALTTGAITVTGLTTGVLYYFRVRAVNAVGSAAAFSPSATATPALLVAGTWSDDVFDNINSGGDYWKVGQFSDGDTFAPALPTGIKEAYGFAQVIAVRQDAAIAAPQYVKIAVPDITGWFLLKLRCSATPDFADTTHNGYTVRRESGFVFWYAADGTGVNFVDTSAGWGTGAGQIEASVDSAHLMTLKVNGVTKVTWNFSATPANGLYQGFGSANANVITYAEGGDVGAAATVPDQVTGLVTHVINANRVDMGWTAPGNGGSPITGYKVERAPDVAGSPGTWTVLTATTGAPSPRIYQDLTTTAGMHVWYRVSAINTVGAGTPSVAAEATAVDPPPPAFSDDFSNGLRMWTVARWRSQMSTAGNAGYVPPSSNDDLHYDGVLGTHTSPPGSGLLPPYDIFVGSNNWLYVGGGSQNYGDTFLRCAQKMDLTGSGPWVIRLGFIPNPNGLRPAGIGLSGWSTVYATDKPMASPSMSGENSAGPVPQYGFAIRLDDSMAYDGTNYHPAPTAFTYNNYAESADIVENVHAIWDIPTTTIVDVVITVTRTRLRITADGEMWFDQPWTLDASLTSAWIYLGAHNHATRKYHPYSDGRGAVYSYLNFDGPTITPQYSYAVADSLVLTNGIGEDVGVPGINCGWGSPTGPLTIPGVPANVSSAKLIMSTHWTPNFPNNNNYFVRYSLNGNATHDTQTDFQCNSGAYSYSFNVNPAELVTGDNTVNISMIGQVGGFPPYVGNISLLVEAFSTGKLAVGNTVLPKIAVGGTDIKFMAIGTKEIWRAPLPPQVPTTPTLIVATATSGQIAARWSQPVDRGAALSDYVLQYRTSPAGTWTPVTHTAGWTRTRAITGLTNLTAYDVRVAARNSIGDSAFSNIVTATPGYVVAAPGQVTGLVATTPGSDTAHSMFLTWAKPAQNNAPITDHKIEYSSNGGSSWTVFGHQDDSINRMTVTGLTASTTYQFRVSAINSAGTGAASAPVTKATTA